MAPKILLPCVIEEESSQTTGASNNAPPSVRQQQHRHHFVHCDNMIVATDNTSKDTDLKVVRYTGGNMNEKRHVIGCESIHIDVDNGQLTVQQEAGVRRELLDQFIAARNWKPPWLNHALVRTVREIEDHNALSSGHFADQFGDKCPRECTKLGLKTLQEATESYMVEVTANSPSRCSN